MLVPKTNNPPGHARTEQLCLPYVSAEFGTYLTLEGACSLDLCIRLFQQHFFFIMEFSFMTIVLLMVIFISLCSTTRQCKTQINKHSLNAHRAPGATAARGRENTAAHGEITALFFTFCKHICILQLLSTFT